jgi:hypothetical protein
MEYRGHQDDRLEDENRGKRNAEQDNRHGANECREHDFAGMKPAGGCRIEESIEMVYAVKSPQPR